MVGTSAGNLRLLPSSGYCCSVGRLGMCQQGLIKTATIIRGRASVAPPLPQIRKWRFPDTGLCPSA